ncbi:related to Mitochondrial outer membrane protein IML2 [Cephalotrichum gorgonifer]|uniref:Inclusion body clearance protein IML2 n=1 Tax=Cephalotrichum gorgonifer TaxID=2041049 RepID=A0AAE8N283_9PEZI|nr:related to Mitochondrial outer membrane protein IML2 [Cephalotrichum gorgonifer]
MARLASWFRAEEPKAESSPSAPSTPKPKPKSKEDVWAEEISSLEDAFSAADLIIDDQMDLAESRLKSSPNSCFHQLSLAVILFIRSILGVEKDVMAMASAQLNDCETRALADQKRAQKEFAGCADAEGKGKCGVYPPGTEYALINAEAMLMGAVVGVLHESLTEGIKSFYKLRKAYFALEAIIQMDVNATQGGAPPTATKPLAEQFAEDRMPGTFGDDEFRDSDEDGAPDPALEGGDSRSTSGSSPSSPSPASTPSSLDPPTSTLPPKTAADSGVFTNPRDVFIHSGAYMCHGTLLFLFTLVPPALSRLLSIIGFKGDRERGIRMLWESTAFPNVHGAIAAIVILSYYNGLLGLADILPPANLYDEDAEVVGPPVEKCRELLVRLRARYPNSGFWYLEQSRMHANARRLENALTCLREMPPSNMKQMDALRTFEMGLVATFAMDWTLMRDSFHACLDLSDWSRTMYLYFEGCAEVELYRDAVHRGDAAEAAARKKAAEEVFARAPETAGKKKFLAKQLPFEVFTLRKLKKWEARAKELGIGLVDAIGVSPAQEMLYLWGGGRRHDAEQAERALGYLEWGRCTAGEEALGKIRGEEEEAVRSVCRASLLRVLGRVGEARGELEGVLKLDRSNFKGPTKDDYILPCAHYEMGALAWTEAIGTPTGGLSASLGHLDLSGGETQTEKKTDEKGDGEKEAGEKEGAVEDGEGDVDPDEFRKKKIAECQASLDKAAAWEAFVLDARCGMKVQTGIETLKWYRKRMGWA